MISTTAGKVLALAMTGGSASGLVAQATGANSQQPLWFQLTVVSGAIAALAYVLRQFAAGKVVSREPKETEQALLKYADDYKNVAEQLITLTNRVLDYLERQEKKGE